MLIARYRRNWLEMVGVHVLFWLLLLLLTFPLWSPYSCQRIIDMVRDDVDGGQAEEVIIGGSMKVGGKDVEQQ